MKHGDVVLSVTSGAFHLTKSNLMQHAAVAMMALWWVQMLFRAVPGELSLMCFPCCRSNSPAFVTVPGKCLCIPCPEVFFFSTHPDKNVFSVQQRLQGFDRLKHFWDENKELYSHKFVSAGEGCLLFVTLHL